MTPDSIRSPEAGVPGSWSFTLAQIEAQQAAEALKAVADFPLFTHHNGPWATKIRGKLH
jgi:hypothetical protein